MQKNYFNLYIPEFILTFIIIYLNAQIGFNIYDEGLILTGAELLQQGKLPYSDFWTLYAPGQFYITSYFFSLFGNSILTSRFLFALTASLLSILIFSIVSKKQGSLRAYIALSTLVLLIISYKPYSRAIITALPLALGSSYLLYLWLDKTKHKLIFFSGVLLGLTAFFRQDIATYIFILNLLIISITSWKLRKEKLFPSLTLYSFGFLAGLILYLPLIFQVGLNTIYHHLFEIPSQIFAEQRSLPLPITMIFQSHYIREIIKQTINSLVFLMPYLALIYLIQRVLKYKNWSDYIKYLPFIALFIAGVNQSIIRADMEHQLWLQISIVLLIGLFAEKSKKDNILAAICILTILALPVAKYSSQLVHFASGSFVEIESAKAAGIYIDKDFATQYNELLFEIESHLASNKSEMIYSGLQSHQQAPLNDAMLYFLTTGGVGTYYMELHPGVTTKKESQNRIISEITNNKIELLILANFSSQEPNKSIEKSGVTILDDYIKMHFEVVKTLGEYQIWELR